MKGWVGLGQGFFLLSVTPRGMGGWAGWNIDANPPPTPTRGGGGLKNLVVGEASPEVAAGFQPSPC